MAKKITKKGYEALQLELKNLIEVVRPDIIDKLKTARSYGDLSENAEYDAARDAQARNEARIAELEEKLAEIDANPALIIPSNIYEVEYKNKQGKKQKLKFEIAGVDEIDPFKKDSKGEMVPIFSNESPLGQALEGAKKGDVVTVVMPTGSVEYTVINVEGEN
ncbi:MAG: transcription elongation factor GreA [Clostridia bacterium]|nr:transcription elongation factor GreA [Clostridia bacterium]